MWNIINEKIPAPILADWKEMNEKIEKIQKHYSPVPEGSQPMPAPVRPTVH
jgi:hypothetical protein